MRNNDERVAAVKRRIIEIEYKKKEITISDIWLCCSDAYNCRCIILYKIFFTHISSAFIVGFEVYDWTNKSSINEKKINRSLKFERFLCYLMYGYRQ